MPSAETIFSDFLFSLRNITASQVVDILLVALVFFILLHFLRRSRATVLLRGTLVLIAFFFIVTVFLPLPTFDYLLQVALIATFIAIPIIFQPELRRFLEGLGRRVGTISFRRMAAETTLKPLVRALENLSANNTGALIVLEGDDDLSEILQTGVPMGGEVTSELLQTIFYDGTPLHDGAVMIRGDRVVAAGCVLPVSNRQLYASQRRLGTRHRAAVGLTETSDALVLVVSEETGKISVARGGRLQSGLDRTALREQIHNFYQSANHDEEAVSLQNLLSELKGWWLSGSRLPPVEELSSDVGIFVLAIVLALATWAFVIQDTNPIRQTRVENIPLQPTNIPAQTQILNQLPQSVAAVVRAPDETMASLGSSSFQAHLSLAGLEPGLHRVPVEVRSSVGPVQVTAVEPQTLDIQLAEIVTRTVDVQVETVGQELLSPALEIRNTARVTPAQVLISGATPLLNQVDHVVAEMPVPNALGTVQQMQPVVPVDEDDNPVAGVGVEPDQVQVSITIARRPNARDVGVRVVTEGQLPPGYRVTETVVEPSRVTVLGTPQQLEDIGNVVSTYPVDLSQAIEDFTVRVPLDLPVDVEAVDPQGQTTRSVLVRVEVEPRMANRVISRQVEILGSAGLPVRLEPATVDIALHGPAPLLNEIEVEPGLLRVVIDASELAEMEPGDSRLITPEIIRPDEVQVRLIPETVRITIQ